MAVEARVVDEVDARGRVFGVAGGAEGAVVGADFGFAGKVGLGVVAVDDAIGEEIVEAKEFEDAASVITMKGERMVSEKSGKEEEKWTKWGKMRENVSKIESKWDKIGRKVQKT